MFRVFDCFVSPIVICIVFWYLMFPLFFIINLFSSILNSILLFSLIVNVLSTVSLLYDTSIVHRPLGKFSSNCTDICWSEEVVF